VKQNQSVREVHTLRLRLSALFPHLMGRTDQGLLSKGIRPTAALIFLYIMERNGGGYTSQPAPHQSGSHLQAMTPTPGSMQFRGAVAEFMRTDSIEEQRVLLDRVFNEIGIL
jgi:hypothetical protein